MNDKGYLYLHYPRISPRFLPLYDLLKKWYVEGGRK